MNKQAVKKIIVSLITVTGFIIFTWNSGPWAALGLFIFTFGNNLEQYNRTN